MMQSRTKRIGQTISTPSSNNPEFEDDDFDGADESIDDPDTSLLADAMLSQPRQSTATQPRGTRGRSIVASPNYYILSKSVVWVGIVTILILFAILFAGLFIAALWYWKAQSVYLADRTVITSFSDVGAEGSVGSGDTTASKALGCETIASFRVVNFAPNETNIGLSDRRGFPSFSGCVKRDSAGTLNVDEVAFYLNTSSGGVPITGLYQAPNGYIGILTTNPLYPLDIYGSAKIRGTLIMGNESTIDFVDPSRIRSSVRGLELSALSSTGVETVGFTVRPDGSTLASNLTVTTLTVVNSLAITTVSTQTISVIQLQSTNGHFNGTLTVDGLTTLNGGAILNGSLTMPLGSLTMSSGSVTLSAGSLTAAVNISSGQWANLNNLIVANAAQVGGTLRVGGDATFLGGVSIAQNLSVSGTLNALSFSFVQGLTVSQTINGSLTVSGSITGGNGLIITSGSSSFAGTTLFSGAVTASNITATNLGATTGTFSDYLQTGRLIAAGATTLATTLTVGSTGTAGSLVIFNTASVGTIVVIGSTATVNIGNTNVAGNLLLYNTVPTATVTLSGATGNAVFAGTITGQSSISASTTLSSGTSASVGTSLTVGTTLGVTGSVTVGSGLIVTGGASVTGGISATLTLSAGTSASVGTSLTVGTTLGVTGSATVGSGLIVTGGVSVTGGISATLALVINAPSLTLANFVFRMSSGTGTDLITFDASGEAIFAGDVYADSHITTSSQLIKTNITDLDNTTALGVVMGIHPRTYRFIPEYDSHQPANLTKAGFIAEEVAANTPGFYKITRPSALTLNISGVPTSVPGLSKDDLLPFLWRAVQILIDRTNKCGCTAT